MEEQKIITDIEEGCIYCLKYFGIFNYPLTQEEIFYFNPFPANPELVQITLSKLVQKGSVFKIDEFYLPDNNQQWVDERRKGNKRAYELLSKSGKYISVIASFPFVKGIAISGSLSKFYASEKADIDYFLITSPNRLWIARTLLHIFKKLTFLTGHQHYYCMNYFVDTNALIISHPNYYSAIETVTLLPAYSAKMIEQFLEENKWVKKYLPNYPTNINLKYLIKERNRPFKTIFERLLNILSPSKFNHYLMRMTDKKWRKKWSGHSFSEEDYNRAFQTEIAISKNHPADFEKKVLSKLAQEITD